MYLLYLKKSEFFVSERKNKICIFSHFQLKNFTCFLFLSGLSSFEFTENFTFFYDRVGIYILYL